MAQGKHTNKLVYKLGRQDIAEGVLTDSTKNIKEEGTLKNLL